jgi:hypothetical protein
VRGPPLSIMRIRGNRGQRFAGSGSKVRATPETDEVCASSGLHANRGLQFFSVGLIEPNRPLDSLNFSPGEPTVHLLNAAR